MAGDFKRLRHGLHPLAADGPVQRHAGGHRAQPAGEAARIAELADLPHGLDEHLLADLLRLGVVAQPAEGDRAHHPLELLEQPAEGVAVALLRGADQLRLGQSGCPRFRFRRSSCSFLSQAEGAAGAVRHFAGFSLRGRGMRESKPHAANANSGKPRPNGKASLICGCRSAFKSPRAYR